MFSKLRPGLTYSNVMATIAVFIALGGGAYAAFKLPKNSVGASHIKANAVSSSKVKNASLLAEDFKAGQLPAGERGAQGPKGDACLASDPNCKGPKGDTGAQGPGATSLDVQVPNDGQTHDLAVVNGIRVQFGCGSVNGMSIGLYRDAGGPLGGFGIVLQDGTLSTLDNPGLNGEFSATGSARAEVDMTVQAQPGKWTSFHLWGIRGGACNMHALIIPPS